MTARQRADRLLVERGLFESRAKAQAAIEAGLVSADDERVRKPSDALRTDVRLAAEAAHPWVSRGGVKLAAALDAFGISVEGRICLDVGASTGGFTEVLIGRGARRVYAVDVGREQLHRRLRGRESIVSLEETDIRALTPERLDGRPDLVTIDVSFISLKHVLPAVSALTARSAQLVALIKPQFEVSRRQLKKGIVREPSVHATVCENIANFTSSLGWTVGKTVPSAILGGEGNHEFFIEAARE